MVSNVPRVTELLKAALTALSPAWLPAVMDPKSPRVSEIFQMSQNRIAYMMEFQLATDGEAEGYGEGDSESDSSSSRERVASETRALIIKEFAARKQNLGKAHKTDNISALYSKCRSADSTGTKVNGLTVANRDSYLSLLSDSLYNNYSDSAVAAPPARAFSKMEVEQCAVDMEYGVFTANKVASLYRRAMAKLIASVKATSGMHPTLQIFEPKKSNTLNAFVKEFEESKKNSLQHNSFGFIKASELDVENTKIEEKQEKVLSKSDKISKRKSNSFRRDPLTQTNLKNFFQNPVDDSFNSSSECSDDSSVIFIDEEPSKYKGRNNSVNKKSDIYNDTTLILNDSTHNNTLIVNDTPDLPKINKKRVVINITLRGIKTSSNSESNTESGKTSPVEKNKDKPRAKKKLKDLFGGSSESDSDLEINEPKKFKSSESLNHNLSKKTSDAFKELDEAETSPVKDNSLKNRRDKCNFKNKSNTSRSTDIDSKRNNDESCNVSDKNEVITESRLKCVIESRESIKNEPRNNNFKIDQSYLRSIKEESARNYVTDVIEKEVEVKPEKYADSKTDHKSSRVDTTVVNDNKKTVLNAERKHNSTEKASTTNYKEKIKPKAAKVDVAGLVVKLLMPYYKKQKISTRDLFKITARHIVHQLLAIQVTEEAAIKELLKDTFNKDMKIEREQDLANKINFIETKLK